MGQWDHPRICNTLIAGDQVVAHTYLWTVLMGHDPGHWLTPPFHRDPQRPANCCRRRIWDGGPEPD